MKKNMNRENIFNSEQGSWAFKKEMKPGSLFGNGFIGYQIEKRKEKGMKSLGKY